MRTSAAAIAFDPAAFVLKVGTGKTIKDYRSRQTVFAQGDPADAVFFVQSGRVKLTVVSSRGKEAVIGVLEAGSFFGEAAWPANSFACPPRVLSSCRASSG